MRMSTLNLHTGAADLARRMSSLHIFEDAARELLQCDTLAAMAFKRHSRKIIRLIEIAHATLTRAGIALHVFASCPPHLQRHKSAYFDLLNALKTHRREIDADLRKRASRLLCPLSTRMVISRRGETLPSGFSLDFYQTFTVHTSRTVRSKTGLHITESRIPPMCESSASMPAPDAFPPSRGRTRARAARNRPKIWSKGLTTLHPDDSPHSPTDPLSPDHDLQPRVYAEDVETWSKLRRPPPRRFGIFFTGPSRNSMFSRRDRPGAFRSN